MDHNHGPQPYDLCDVGWQVIILMWVGDTRRSSFFTFIVPTSDTYSCRLSLKSIRWTVNIPPPFSHYPSRDAFWHEWSMSSSWGVFLWSRLLTETKATCRVLVLPHIYNLSLLRPNCWVPDTGLSKVLNQGLLYGVEHKSCQISPGAEGHIYHWKSHSTRNVLFPAGRMTRPFVFLHFLHSCFAVISSTRLFTVMYHHPFAFLQFSQWNTIPNILLNTLHE